MLKITKIILSIIVIVLGLYGLITHNNVALPYEMFLLALVMIMNGIVELRQKRKNTGISYISVAVFLFFVFILKTIFR